MPVSCRWGKDDVANWTAKVAAAFHAIAGGLRRRKKVKSTSFDETNEKAPFNASGVAQVGPGRFVFIDNHDPSALFELALDADGTAVERISRRPMASVAEGQLRDPEGLTRVGRDDEIFLIVASSLCVLDGQGDNKSVTAWCAFATHPTVTCTQKRCRGSATGYCATCLRSPQPASENRTQAG